MAEEGDNSQEKTEDPSQRKIEGTEYIVFFSVFSEMFFS
jgi:hypothetical protein